MKGGLFFFWTLALRGSPPSPKSRIAPRARPDVIPAFVIHAQHDFVMTRMHGGSSVIPLKSGIYASIRLHSRKALATCVS